MDNTYAGGIAQNSRQRKAEPPAWQHVDEWRWVKF